VLSSVLVDEYSVLHVVSVVLTSLVIDTVGDIVVVRSYVDEISEDKDDSVEPIVLEEESVGKSVVAVLTVDEGLLKDTSDVVEKSDVITVLSSVTE
jgi:hypothetical protein